MSPEQRHLLQWLVLVGACGTGDEHGRPAQQPDRLLASFG
jgi:hypothetical protein